jgi:glycerol transport system ATP-binding protein
VQKRSVAMVYQQFINYPTLSVFENIASPLRLAGKDRAEIDRAVRATADLLRLGALLDRRPLELSGGQQQRTALARALVKGAGLVLLDEPLANLDYKLREELRAEVPRIFQASGAIFVYATTEPHEALLLGGSTATLHEGRVTQFGPTPAVYRLPRDMVTARTFSDPPMNFLPVGKAGARLDFGEGQTAPAPAGLADGRYVAGFRPHHLSLAPRPGMRFETRVEVTEITGSETFAHLAHGDAHWIALAHGVHDLAAGAAQAVWLDPAHVYLFRADGMLAAPASFAEAA